MARKLSGLGDGLSRGNELVRAGRVESFFSDVFCLKFGRTTTTACPELVEGILGFAELPNKTIPPC